MNEQRPDIAGDPGREAVLAERLVSLADSLVKDFDVVELLENLMHTCVELLGVDHGGLLLIDQRGNLQLVAASSEASRLMELLQLQSDEGPCLECVATGAQVSVTELATHTERWPTFTPAATAVGFTGVYALPLRLRSETIGGLNLFTSREASSLDKADLRVAQALADVATIGILQQRSVSRNALLAEQLQTALNSRLVIEQAKGVLAERGGLDMQSAFDRLRRHARSNNLNLSAVARTVVTDRRVAHAVLHAMDDVG